MAEIKKKPVQIVETVLRDAHQSLVATRMTTEQMLPIIDKMDKVGYKAVECWGGATFDASLRFLHEDPWERLRKFKDGFKNTKLQMLFRGHNILGPLQMLLRGQNILGYRHYADDVVEYFVQKSVANGIDIIRIFDALNDIRNLKTAVNAANKEKNAEVQIALCYTLGDAYTLDYWKDIAKMNRFIRFCNTYSLPILTLCDTTGFENCLCNEKHLGKEMAELLSAYGNASVPMVTVVKKAVGSAGACLGSKGIGADLVFAYPESEITVMEPGLAANILYPDESLEEREAKAKRYLEEKASAESAAARGYIDALIFPEETRQRVISALDMLYGKADFDFHKKFGSI